MLFPNTRMQEKKEEVRELQDVIRNVERGEWIEQEEERNLVTLARNISSLRETILRGIFGKIKTMEGTISSLEIMAVGLERVNKVRRTSDEYHMVEQYYAEVWAQIKNNIQMMIPETERKIMMLIQKIEIEFKNILRELQEEEQLDKKEEQELVKVGREVQSEE